MPSAATHDLLAAPLRLWRLPCCPRQLAVVRTPLCPIRCSANSSSSSWPSRCYQLPPDNAAAMVHAPARTQGNTVLGIAGLGAEERSASPTVNVHAQLAAMVVGLTATPAAHGQQPRCASRRRRLHRRRHRRPRPRHRRPRPRRHPRRQRRRRRPPFLSSPPAHAPSIRAPRTAFARPTFRRITATTRRAPSRRLRLPLERP
jgi:hypothetical protein